MRLGHIDTSDTDDTDTDDTPDTAAATAPAPSCAGPVPASALPPTPAVVAEPSIVHAQAAPPVRLVVPDADQPLAPMPDGGNLADANDDEDSRLYVCANPYDIDQRRPSGLTEYALSVPVWHYTSDALPNFVLAAQFNRSGIMPPRPPRRHRRDYLDRMLATLGRERHQAVAYDRGTAYAFVPPANLGLPQALHQCVSQYRVRTLMGIAQQVWPAVQPGCEPIYVFAFRDRIQYRLLAVDAGPRARPVVLPDLIMEGVYTQYGGKCSVLTAAEVAQVEQQYRMMLQQQQQPGEQPQPEQQPAAPVPLQQMQILGNQAWPSPNFTGYFKIGPLDLHNYASRAWYGYEQRAVESRALGHDMQGGGVDGA